MKSSSRLAILIAAALLSGVAIQDVPGGGGPAQPRWATFLLGLFIPPVTAMLLPGLRRRERVLAWYWRWVACAFTGMWILCGCLLAELPQLLWLPGVLGEVTSLILGLILGLIYADWRNGPRGRMLARSRGDQKGREIRDR
jgi:hypothetical protein